MVGAIADPEPEDLRSILSVECAFGKIFVLCYNDPIACNGEVPNGGIRGFPQTSIPDRHGFVIVQFKELCQTWRQLRIDKETHFRNSPRWDDRNTAPHRPMPL